MKIKVLLFLNILLLIGLFFYYNFIGDIYEIFYFKEGGFFKFQEKYKNIHTCPISFFKLSSVSGFNRIGNVGIKIIPEIVDSEMVGCRYLMANFSDTPILFNSKSLKLGLNFKDAVTENSLDTRLLKVSQTYNIDSSLDDLIVCIPPQSVIQFFQKEIMYDLNRSVALSWTIWIPYGYSQYFWGTEFFPRIAYAHKNSITLTSNRILILKEKMSGYILRDTDIIWEISK